MDDRPTIDLDTASVDTPGMPGPDIEEPSGRTRHGRAND